MSIKFCRVNKMNNELNFREIRFVERPKAIPYNYRISYKIAQIVLIIGKTVIRGGCSFLKIQIISQALKSNENFKELLNFANEQSLFSNIIKFDPAINKAIEYALVDNILTKQKDGKFKLTTLGKEIYKEIEEDENLMCREKKNIKEISGKINEDKIKEILDVWRNYSAKNK